MQNLSCVWIVFTLAYLRIFTRYKGIFINANFDLKSVPEQKSDVTNIGQYERWTFKRRTDTSVGLRQTSD